MVLSNPQFEAYAQHRATGLNKTESARRANYAESTCANVGCRLEKKPRIRARINELKEAQELVPAGLVGNVGIRNPQARVTAKEDRWNRMRLIMSERGKDPEFQHIPGYRTGLLCVTYKFIGPPKTGREVIEYKLDSALLAELRAHEQETREELGQAVTRTENYRESVNLDLGAVLREQLSLVSASERAKILESSPALAETLAKVEAIDIKAVKDEENK